MLIMKNAKGDETEGIELTNEEKIRTLGEKKPTNTCEYWKHTLLDMQR